MAKKRRIAGYGPRFHPRFKYAQIVCEDPDNNIVILRDNAISLEQAKDKVSHISSWGVD